MKYSKNLLGMICLGIIISVPTVANAASNFIETNSIGRFEYDSNNDNKSDIVIDSADVKNISKSEENNANNITDLQSNYNNLLLSLNSANDNLNTILASGTAVSADILTGKTALVKGMSIVGSMTNNGSLNDFIYPNEKYNIATGYTDGGTIIVDTGIPDEAANEQATDSNGRKLYYIDATAQTNKDLTSVTTTANSYPVLYIMASSDNLTAGSAAWVNGIFVKGNGKNYDTAYSRGNALSSHTVRMYFYVNGDVNKNGIPWCLIVDGKTVFNGSAGFYSTVDNTYTIK